MSGYAGILNLDGEQVDPELLSRMTNFLRYRGPDSQQTWIGNHIGLGHSLLNTTNDPVESQPACLDGKLWIIADARIDDRETLIQKLEAATGVRLVHPDDAHLILLAFRTWGPQCVDHLMGDFSFAIWDVQQERIFCARDQFGIKPFFYSRSRSAFIFSNTLNCIRLHPEVPGTFNETAIGDFLLFDYNQDTGSTVFQSILRLPPGHFLVCSRDSLHIQRYWSLPIEEQIQYKRRQEYVEHFKDLFQTAVRDRLRTNKVAVWMSGGMDSPSVATIAQKELVKQNIAFDLRAFTVVYDSLIPDDERYYSGLVAKNINIPIKHLPADSYLPFAGEEKSAVSTPEPYHNPWSAVSTDQYRDVASFCRVGLTGYGGDPLFYSSNIQDGGSSRRLILDSVKFLFRYRQIPRIGLRSLMLRRNRIPFTMPRWLDEDFEKRTDLLSRWNRWLQRPSAIHPDRPRAYRWLTNQFWPHRFESVEPGVSTFPVEVRYPFFDIRLVRYLFRVPALPWFVDKQILRNAMKDSLPEEVISRPKAPMRGYPEVEMVRSQGFQPFKNFEPEEELSRFVNVRKLHQSFVDGTDLDIWTNLRPISFNNWLKKRNNAVTL